MFRYCTYNLIKIKKVRFASVFAFKFLVKHKLAIAVQQVLYKQESRKSTESPNIAAITETRLNLFSWVFCGSPPSIAELMKFLQRTNVREKSREQELTGTEVARKIAKESGRGLKKGGENYTEQCESRKNQRPL